jgi:hypothetical protein
MEKRISLLHSGRLQVCPRPSESSSQMEYEERRRTKRYRFKFPLKVTWSRTRELQTETADLSSRGVYFYLTERLPVGTPLQFVLTLYPDLSESELVRLKCRGYVRRIHAISEGRIGIAATIDHYDFVRL